MAGSGLPAMPPVEELRARHAVRDAGQAASRARASQSGPFGASRNEPVQAAIQQVVEAREAQLREAKRQQSELFEHGRRRKEQQLMLAYCKADHKEPRKKKKSRPQPKAPETLAATVVGREPATHEPERSCCTTVWGSAPSVDPRTAASPPVTSAACAIYTVPSNGAVEWPTSRGPPSDTMKRSHQPRAPAAPGSNFERRLESRAVRVAERRAEVMAEHTQRPLQSPPFGAGGPATAAASHIGAAGQHEGPEGAAAHTEARGGGGGEGGGEGGAYPPALRSWIVRCLAGATDASQSLELRKRIKSSIAKAGREGTIWQTDWEAEPSVEIEPLPPSYPPAAAPLTSSHTPAAASDDAPDASLALDRPPHEAEMGSAAAAGMTAGAAEAPTESRRTVEAAQGGGRRFGTKHRREPPQPGSPDARSPRALSVAGNHSGAVWMAADTHIEAVGGGSSAGGNGDSSTQDSLAQFSRAEESAGPRSPTAGDAANRIAGAAAAMSRLERIATLTPSWPGRTQDAAAAAPSVARASGSGEGGRRNGPGGGAGYLSRGAGGRPSTPGQLAAVGVGTRDGECSSDGEESAAVRTSPRTELRLRRKSAAAARADHTELTSDAAVAACAAPPHPVPVASSISGGAAVAEAVVTSRVAARRKAEMARSRALAREVELPPAASPPVPPPAAPAAGLVSDNSGSRCYFGPGHAGSADATADDVESIEVVGAEPAGFRRPARRETWKAFGPRQPRGEAVPGGRGDTPATAPGASAVSTGGARVRSATFGGGDPDAAGLMIAGSGAAPVLAGGGVVSPDGAPAGGGGAAKVHRPPEPPPPLVAASGPSAAAARVAVARPAATGSLGVTSGALNGGGGSTGGGEGAGAGVVPGAAAVSADGGIEQLSAARERMARLGLSNCGSVGALGSAQAARAAGARPRTGDDAWHWPWAQPDSAIAAAALSRARPASARPASRARPRTRPASAGAIRPAAGGTNGAGGGGSRMFHALSAEGGGPEWKREERELEILLSALGNGRPLTATMAEPCCICLEGMCAGNLAMTLPCSHVFHSACIMRWLHKAQNCPLCKNDTLRSLAGAR